MIPDTATSAAVPRSGCIRMSAVGAPTMIKAPTVFKNFGGRGLLERKAATVSGITTLKISEGWRRTTPRSSQRCAPLEMSPKSSTMTKSTTPPA